LSGWPASLTSKRWPRCGGSGTAVRCRSFSLLVTEADPRRLLLVGEQAGELAGYGVAGAFEPAAGAPRNHAPEGWYLLGLVVRPDRRRLGVGAQLTRSRLVWIYERAPQAYYFANRLNLATIALHARFGFQELTRDFWYPGVTFTGGHGILFRAAAPHPGAA
jgi:GNAT superfamily N-acetyltransferase